MAKDARDVFGARVAMRIEPGEDGGLMITHWFVLLAATVR